MAELHQEDIPMPDRRQGNVSIDAELAVALREHLGDEEVRHRKTDDAMKAGAERMSSIERELAAISMLISSVKGFIKAIPIVTSVFAALIAVFTWAILDKSSDIKKTQETLHEYAVQSAKIVGVLDTVVKEQERASRRLDGYMDRDQSKK